VKPHSGEGYNNEELHNFYASPVIIVVIKSRKIRWAGHVERMGEMRSACKILFGKPEGKYRSGDLGVDGKIIVEWILGK
jgi:hypothetical protein